METVKKQKKEEERQTLSMWHLRQTDRHFVAFPGTVCGQEPLAETLKNSDVSRRAEQEESSRNSCESDLKNYFVCSKLNAQKRQPASIPAAAASQPVWCAHAKICLTERLSWPWIAAIGIVEHTIFANSILWTVFFNLFYHRIENPLRRDNVSIQTGVVITSLSSK